MRRQVRSFVKQQQLAAVKILWVVGNFCACIAVLGSARQRVEIFGDVW
jgi:hypothetical protein